MTCPECGSDLPPAAPTGRPRVYCGTQCRRTVEHRIARTRRLCERLEVRLIDIRIALEAAGGSASRHDERRAAALTAELDAAEERLRDLLAQRAKDGTDGT